MRFSTLSSILAAATVFFSGSLASPATLHLTSRAADSAASLGTQLAQSNHYGAPIPPWETGCSPGWYYGDHVSLLDILGLTGLPYLKDTLICLVIDLLPLCLHCPHPPSHPPPPPPPPHGWNPVFTGLTAAIQADDYLTYGLVDTVAQCQTMCEDVNGCTFFNTYHDVNGKDGSTLLTCALFSLCHTSADAINAGGQTQPNGSVDFITDSAGYCHT